VIGGPPPPAGPVPVSLMSVPAHERNDPLFRQGYNLGVQHQAQRERMVELDSGQPLRQFGASSSAPASFGVTASVPLNDLTDGVIVVREISRIGPKWYTTETPCCGRPLRLPVTPDDGQRAMCCHCGITYQAEREQEAPDGYSEKPTFVAVLTVEHVGVAAALHSRGQAGQGRPR
jgi:hypothetical protein